MSNIGRAILKKMAVIFEGNDILSIDDFDIFACFQDLWKTASEKKNAVRQGIISTDGCKPNCIKLKINADGKDATNVQDQAIADAYGNKFIIPLAFEMLDSAAPYYQVGLGNRLCYEIKLNDYNRIINSSKTDATYKITDISVEYQIVTQPNPARSIRSEYDERALYYDRILQHRKVIVYKSDTIWNWTFNTPCKSLKGILLLFQEEKPFVRDTSRYYIPKIRKVSVIIEGKPNQLHQDPAFEKVDFKKVRHCFSEKSLI